MTSSVGGPRRVASGAYVVVIIALVAALAVVASCGPKGPSRLSPPPILKVASQKGGTKALMLASHALDGAPYQVEWSEFPSAQALLEALGANAVDLGGVGDAPFLFAYANDPKLKVVQAGRSQAGGKSVGVVVPSASPIRTASDLRGKRIATGKGSIGHYLLLRVLDQAHIPLSAVRVVYLSPATPRRPWPTARWTPGRPGRPIRNWRPAMARAGSWSMGRGS